MTEQIKRVIANGKPLAVIQKLIKEELLRLDRVKFDEAIKAEYDKLFPMYRQYTEEEYQTYIDGLEEGHTVLPIESLDVEIDYSEDENYVTFEEYKNETRVIQEAVYESKEVLDSSENNTVVIYEDVLVTPEVTELVRPYIAIEVTNDDIESVQVYKEYKYKLVKASILKAIATMRVEVDGLAYDGNEPSQARMDRAIQTLVGSEAIPWRMYDNSIEVITQTELGKALRASGILMSKLWFCSSVEEVEAIVSNDDQWLLKYNAS